MGMNFKNYKGYVFPASDTECGPAVLSTLKDLEAYYPFVRNFNVAVQAGGNVGIWPAKMAEKFENVYTFEPDPDNFACLAHNAMLPNVHKFQAALGDNHQGVKLWTNPNNVGAHYVDGTGPIRTLTIDDLNLPMLDFVMLDVEGYELNALKGGNLTIQMFRPTIVIEEKGHGKRYNSEDTVEYLKALGYRHVHSVHRDMVFTWS